ncbi:hypothetical protein FHS15_004195 [Paenibacillus castaneae]|nr:hypothetical protein [Paenibacillus castaneae]NIK79049.1 hypothetical protein [Paenibacillus castaneae]
MIREWKYPPIGIVIYVCPSGGHDAVMLDYRDCGPDRESKVVHADLVTSEHPIIPLAENFTAFIAGLVHENLYRN